MTIVQNEATLSKNAGLGQAHPQKQLAVKVLMVDSDKYEYLLSFVGHTCVT